MIYRAVSYDIEVMAEPEFLANESDPKQGRWFWAYTITIANHGSKTVRLISRHWRITDGQGRVHDVRGAGVVGEQPVIRPGEHYRYTSGCPLDTPQGIMVGDYQMQSETGDMITVAIPAFSLDSQMKDRVLH